MGVSGATRRAARIDNVDIQPYELGREFRQSFHAVLAEAIFDDDVSALDIAKLAQALLETRQLCRIAGRSAGE
jgi:hypothetical protein